MEKSSLFVEPEPQTIQILEANFPADDPDGHWLQSEIRLPPVLYLYVPIGHFIAVLVVEPPGQ